MENAAGCRPVLPRGNKHSLNIFLEVENIQAQAHIPNLPLILVCFHDRVLNAATPPLEVRESFCKTGGRGGANIDANIVRSPHFEAPEATLNPPQVMAYISLSYVRYF